MSPTARFKVSQPVQIQSACVDSRRQWSKAGNIWQNAVIRTTLYCMAAQLRWVARPLRSGGRPVRGARP